MGFHAYATPYDWSRLAGFRRTATQVPGGAVDLSVGSPVDPVPDAVRAALARACDAPGYPRAVGSDELRRAIVRWFLAVRGVDLHALRAGVMPTVGSKEAVALMASLLGLGPGDVVVQPRISYPTYEIGTQLAGARALKVDDVADVDSWSHAPGVKAIWVNSPCNPSGEILDRTRQEEVVKAARRIGAVVLSDECYAMFDWHNGLDTADAGSAQAASILERGVSGGSADGLLCLYSLSKQSNMAGYRAALIAGDATLIKSMADYRRQIGLLIPGPVQAAMVAALGDVGDVQLQRRRYARRLRVLVRALRAFGYDARMPQGGLYVWVRALHGDCWSDMGALARLGIIPSPGEFYGDARCLRFTATAADDVIDDAARRLTEDGSKHE